MISRTISAAKFASSERREELRFIRNIKGPIREALAEEFERVGLTQAGLGELAGVDPAQVSRALGPDSHVSTQTIFRLIDALGRRGRLVLEEKKKAGDAPHVSMITSTYDTAQIAGWCGHPGSLLEKCIEQTTNPAEVMVTILDGKNSNAVFA